MTKGIRKLQKNTQGLLDQLQIGHSWTTGEIGLDRTDDQIRNLIFSCHYVPDIVWDIWDHSPASALTYALDINNSRKYAIKILEVLDNLKNSPYKQTNYEDIRKIVWSMFQYDPVSACRYVATIQQRQGFIPTQYDELVHQHKKFTETIKINSYFSDNQDLIDVGLDERALLLTFSSRSALNILRGKKTVELRKIKPRYVNYVLIYDREIKQIVGSFNGSLIGKKNAKEWLQLYKDQLQLSASEVNLYLGNAAGYGIGIDNVVKFPNPIPQKSLPNSSNNPGNKEFRYLSSHQVKQLGVSCDQL